MDQFCHRNAAWVRTTRKAHNLGCIEAAQTTIQANAGTAGLVPPASLTTIMAFGCAVPARCTIWAADRSDAGDGGSGCG
eukprot:1142640-Pelagomonas_calceolata.AAC.15